MVHCSRTRDWASLHQDLVELIGWRVLAGDIQDYVRFRAVCSQWNASTVRPRGLGVRDPRFHPRGWMMLPEGHGLYPGHPDLRGYVRFFNLSSGAFARAHLPMMDDHVALDSVDGLLLLHRDHDTAIRLLHPFTGDVAELPPLDSLLPQMEAREYDSEDHKRCFLRRVCAAVAVRPTTGAVTVMLALDQLHRVAYATTGERRWTLSTWKLHPLLKPVSFQGKIYAIHYLRRDRLKVHIYRIDPLYSNADGSHSKSGPSPEKIAECPRDKIAYAAGLVNCGSELWLVGYSDTSRAHLVVYRLADLISRNIAPITSIGDHTLFLDERCLCVSSNKGLPSMLSNSIICMHSPGIRRCTAVEYDFRLKQYDLESGTWTPASDGDGLQSPPLNPCTLIHHIFTCCHRAYWNKGIMFCRGTDPNWLVKPSLRIGV